MRGDDAREREQAAEKACEAHGGDDASCQVRAAQRGSVRVTSCDSREISAHVKAREYAARPNSRISFLRNTQFYSARRMVVLGRTLSAWHCARPLLVTLGRPER